MTTSTEADATTIYPLPVQVDTYVIRRPKLTVYVPQIRGRDGGEAVSRINVAIRRQAVRLIRMTGYGEAPETEVTGSYETKLNERHYLSLTLIVYGYTAHAAHGMTYQAGMTMDVRNGRELKLADLFKPGAPYVKVLSDHVAAQIKARDIPVLEPFTEIRPDQDFYMTDKALVLFFGLYELAPYAYGFQYFPLSIYTLQDIKAENGMIDALWY
ncbi:DUF3298 and DUF4163 domain-containing protein [Paenibacillus dendritiformis]|uniref:DUF3298 and DUF4163 domain-containing protein n=1 Tax=Paenibacillus dendritiformis TaxID=130049 RepID=UPI00143CF5AE|nr:DUF3298 and DUF4163 domain-containing protein [Paenibacillus dendritiformis]NKI22486.1 DUF3298 and DUF4163 domain-containing protein [Paenibacillus dendritiformis]NRF97685.1 DUF3298 domain-containing protein [Paenibacillus dendritiformis]